MSKYDEVDAMLPTFDDFAREGRTSLTKADKERYAHFDRRITEALSNTVLNRTFGALHVLHHVGYTTDSATIPVLYCWCLACGLNTRERKSDLLSGKHTHCGCLEGRPGRNANMPHSRARAQHVLQEDIRSLGKTWVQGWLWGAYHREPLRASPYFGADMKPIRNDDEP